MQDPPNAYLTNVGGFILPSTYTSKESSSSPYSRGKILEENSLHEKLNILSAQIKERKELSEKFEIEAQGCINELLHEKERLISFRQDTSGVETSISRTRLSVLEEKSKAWKDIRELEAELIEVELELNKRRVRNRTTYQNEIPL